MFLICGLIPSVVFLEIPMALQRSDVEKIAHLARLGLNEGELPRTTMP